MPRTPLRGRNVREHSVHFARIAIAAGLGVIALLAAVAALLFSI